MHFAIIIVAFCLCCGVLYLLANAQPPLAL